MTIPAITYPEAIDTDQNLFLVHDSLRMSLAEDYNPGDTSITVTGKTATMALFNSTGIITLTEQCSEPKLRAISFYYGSLTATTFEQLELLPGFVDCVKPKNLTDVTQNVVATHHNNPVNALIAIEDFAGKKGEVGLQPLQGTIEQRINYLRNLVLIPKAWFSVDVTTGLAPLSVIFTNQSFRMDTDGVNENVKLLWDFGDNTGPSIVTIDETGVVPPDVTNVLVYDVGGGPIQKTYTRPGIYSPTLTVTNNFGSDTVTFPNLIMARFPAPDYAVIDFIQYSGQILTPGEPIGGPYTTPPTIRAVANSIIDVIINSGINSNTGETYAGEVVDASNNPIDPIETYTWSFSDDLAHNNAPYARAVFSVGGIYDLTLRVDTEFGAYRITNYSGSFDIIESINLWLWTYTDSSLSSVSSSEFGLISETFKTTSSNILNLATNESFLTNQINSAQQLREFRRNNGFAQRTAATSGNGGTGLLYWASGRNAMASPSSEEITMSEHNGFLETYVSRPSISRPWNWVSFASITELYFILGGVTSSIAPNTSPTNQVLDVMQLNNLNVSATTLTPANYKNGADELTQNEVSYSSGVSQQGNMSVYRSAWHNDNSTGYFLRNQGVGEFFRIMSFYKTSGNLIEPFQNIQKLPDIAGDAKTEGQLVSLSQGIYFFNNSGSVAAYNPTSGTWVVGGPGINSAVFQSLQDTSVVGFNDPSQTLLAASDGDNTVYLSFDYSTNAFIKFNQADTTFSAVTPRPSGSQWMMQIY